MTPPLSPRGYFMLRGKLIVRRAGWLKTDDRIECPFGHGVKEHAVLLDGTGVMWCKHIEGPRYPECGALIYVAQSVHLGRYCADVTREEMKLMQREHMTAAEIFNYLGVEFPAGSMIVAGANDQALSRRLRNDSRRNSAATDGLTR